MVKKRYLEDNINADLREKMVFIGGPRQVGKTTLSQQIGEQFKYSNYLNWDNIDDRKVILHRKFIAEAKLLIFDELHKYKMWKNYIKGEFDKNKDKFSILVTGSARLDLYRRGGDSLMGRYHYYRLHPFSLTEVAGIKNKIYILKPLIFLNNKKIHNYFLQLFTFGGFPEPYIKKNSQTLRRFHNERLERLIKEDIRDVESVRDLSALQILVGLLPEKACSLLSLNSLKEDLQVNHKTIALWMDILERFYYHYRLYPYTGKTIKSLKKEPKLYLWDWSQINEKGKRLENMVASHLLKFVHFLYDALGYQAELFFVRDQEGREVDFLVTIEKKPWLMIEVKLSEQKISKNLIYFKKRIKPLYCFQLVKESDVDYWVDDIRLMSAEKFLSGLL